MEVKDGKAIRQGIMVYCKKCKPDIEPIIEEFELFDVYHCPHVNIMNKIYFPQWTDLYHIQKEVKE